jgi:hypothetical protein
MDRKTEAIVFLIEWLEDSTLAQRTESREAEEEERQPLDTQMRQRRLEEMEEKGK